MLLALLCELLPCLSHCACSIYTLPYITGNYAFGSAAKDYRRRKRQMERDITRSMFSIRVTEMKAAWLQNK